MDTCAVLEVSTFSQDVKDWFFSRDPRLKYRDAELEFKELRVEGELESAEVEGELGSVASL